LGTILPLAFVALVCAVLITVVLLGYLKYKRPKLILKVTPPPMHVTILHQ
jgi:hypothetical protein